MKSINKALPLHVLSRGPGWELLHVRCPKLYICIVVVLVIQSISCASCRVRASRRVRASCRVREPSC
jgi:hypothetical protein